MVTEIVFVMLVPTSNKMMWFRLLSNAVLALFVVASAQVGRAFAAAPPAQANQITPVTRQWISDLKAADVQQRVRAADQLGALRAKAAVSNLVSALSDSDARVREAAAFALAEIADQTPASNLVRILAGDSDSTVRASAAFALGMIGDAKAAPGLEDALDDSAAEVRSAALVALGLMGSDDSVEDIEDMLNDSSYDVRYDAVWALGQIADPESAEHLRATLVDLDLVQMTPTAREAFREAVQAALDSIQDKASAASGKRAGSPRSGRTPEATVKMTGSHPATLRLSVMPARTQQAISAGIGGTVELKVLVGADGRVVRAYVLHRLRNGLDQRAVETALLFKYFPRTHDGLPQTDWETLNISFPSK